MRTTFDLNEIDPLLILVDSPIDMLRNALHRPKPPLAKEIRAARKIAYSNGFDVAVKATLERVLKAYKKNSGIEEDWWTNWLVTEIKS